MSYIEEIVAPYKYQKVAFRYEKDLKYFKRLGAIITRGDGFLLVSAILRVRNLDFDYLTMKFKSTPYAEIPEVEFQKFSHDSFYISKAVKVPNAKELDDLVLLVDAHMDDDSDTVTPIKDIEGETLL